MKTKLLTPLLSVLLGVLVLTFSNCGEDEPAPSFTVGGTVSGASGPLTIVLGNEELQVSGYGSFTFTTKLVNGAQYTVTVKTPPDGQFAKVTNGSGTINNANVTDVSVTCLNEPTESYTIGGTLSGAIFNFSNPVYLSRLRILIYGEIL
jgi:hypothetical protein